jgi:hypothetical protein
VIRFDLASNTVEFETASGEIYEGTGWTDLPPGSYEITPNFKTKHWIIEGSKPGLHFYVDLEGNDPWRMAYPEKLRFEVRLSQVFDTEACTELDKLIDQQISALETGANNIPSDPGFAKYAETLKKSVIPNVRNIITAARTFAAAAQKSSTDADRKDNERKAGARYQAALIISQTFQLDVNLMLVSWYANAQGKLPSVAEKSAYAKAPSNRAAFRFSRRA